MLLLSKIILTLAVAVELCVISTHQQSCSKRENQDIGLPNLSSKNGQPESNCCSVCQKTPGCKGYAWNSHEGGTCWLKSGTEPLVKADGVTVGILDSGSGCSVRQNQDIGLPNLASRNGQPEANCCSICQSTAGCKGYAWNSFEGGTCWLKAGTGPLVSANGVNAGFLNDNDNGGGGALVTYTEFQNAVVNSNGFPSPTQRQYDAFIQGLPKGLISTKQEAAMALTHFIHESDGLRAKREYACEKTGCPGQYETNDCDAPGQDYYGRGYIQLSWCYNYRPASQDLFGDNRLVLDADMVARDENIAWNTAFWFWKTNVHSRSGVAEGQFGVTTRAINGGLECNGGYQHVAKHRYQMYGRVRSAFGLSGAGDERGCYN